MLGVPCIPQVDSGMLFIHGESHLLTLLTPLVGSVKA